MKSGFISVVGRTNAGKSSLVNFLLAQKITMVSHKQNATRRKLTAIVMHGKDQLVFIDTPGLNGGAKTLNRLLNESALSSLVDCDLALFVASVFDDLSEYEKFLAQNPPRHVVALTKIDLASREQLFSKLAEYQNFASKFEAIVPVCVKKQAYRKILLDELCKYLPEHPHYYDSEFLTASSERDIYKDFILEAIFEATSDEVPYSCEVAIKKVVEKPALTEIYADIITDNEHRKAILIGAIKRIGIVARKLVCTLNGGKVYLALNVRVDKNWTSNEKAVRKFIQI